MSVQTLQLGLNMAHEIERKFLVLPNWEAHLASYEHIVDTRSIRQGYLVNTPELTIRIRLVSSQQALITVKGPTTGITRSEYEYEIPYDDGIDLMNFCTRAVAKTRHEVYDNQHNITWEVDVFYGLNEGLIIAEIELASEHQEVPLPSWVTVEVSNDSRYTNAQLVNNKAPVL